MSAKRQKLGDTECGAIVREALEEYMISDLAAIIMDDYMPVVHWTLAEADDPDKWIKLCFPCSVDCREHKHLSVKYKYKAPEQGPFRLRTFATDCKWVGDLGFHCDYRLGFGHEPTAIEVSMEWSGPDAKITIHPIHEYFTGEGIDDLVNTAIGCAQRSCNGLYAQI